MNISRCIFIKIQHSQYDYFTVMCKFCLNTLADRRINANLTFLQNLVDGYVDTSTILSQFNFNIPPCYARLKVLLIVPFHSTNYGRNHALDQIMRLANGLYYLSYLLVLVTSYTFL